MQLQFAVRRSPELSDELFQTLVESMNEGAAALTATGQVVFCNRRMFEMAGLPEERIHGANFSSLLTREGKEQFPYLLRRALTSQVRAETDLATAGRGAVRVLLSMSQISLDVGAGVCLVLTDLTDQKRAEDELRRLNTEMEHRAESYGRQVVEAHKELESFSYAVAHDLRAPLRHIHGFSEMLAHDMDTIFSADSRHYLQRISSGVKRMEELITHLLNLSRVTRQPLSRQPTELGALLQDIVNQSESEMNGRTIEWRIGPLPTWNCDPPLTRLVLLNLVSNAIKFTRGRLPAVIEIGEVLINGTSTVFVKDNGAGFNMRPVVRQQSRDREKPNGGYAERLP